MMGSNGLRVGWRLHYKQERRRTERQVKSCYVCPSKTRLRPAHWQNPLSVIYGRAIENEENPYPSIPYTAWRLKPFCLVLPEEAI
jgi:hypothetical protein